MEPEQSSFLYLLNDIMLVVKPVRKLFARISPFILLSSLFIFLFPYFLITGEGSIQSAWLKLALFPALIVNVLLMHLVLWKYFQAKSFFIPWMMEFVLSALIIYLLL